MELHGKLCHVKSRWLRSSPFGMKLSLKQQLLSQPKNNCYEKNTLTNCIIATAKETLNHAKISGARNYHFSTEERRLFLRKKLTIQTPEN